MIGMIDVMSKHLKAMRGKVSTSPSALVIIDRMESVSAARIPR